MDLLISWLNQGFSVAVPFVILLGFLIFVHELGHFLVAKWCGVRVEVFSLGFGKKIIQKKVGDTNYCISIVPLGGYVKMFGDEIGANIPEEDKKYSFTNKTVWQRIAVVLAGPMMNFFFAILIFAIVAMTGEEVRRSKIGDVAEGTVAYANGFRSGDEIIKINDEPVLTWEALQEELTHSVGMKIKFELQREGTSHIEKIEASPVLKQNDSLVSFSDTIGEVPGLSNSSRAPYVGIPNNTEAEKLGLKTGDRIISVNNRSVSYFRELENIFVSLQGQPAEIEVEREVGGSSKPSKMKLQAHLKSVSSLASLGVESADLYLAKVMENTPAKAAGLQEGDRIIGINEVIPKQWDDVLNTVKSYSGQGALKVTVLRNNEQKKFEITPQMTTHMTHQGAEEKRFTIGIVPWLISSQPPTKILPSQGLFASIGRGYKKTIDMTAMTIMSFLRLVQNKISPKNIGGVLAIGQAASETFKIGINHFLQLMAVISVNLFILNLLPIPVLDGGHLLFYSIEVLRGAPLSMRKMEIAQQVGLVLLMSLMVLSLFNDFSRVLGLW